MFLIDLWWYNCRDINLFWVGFSLQLYFITCFTEKCFFSYLWAGRSLHNMLASDMVGSFVVQCVLQTDQVSDAWSVCDSDDPCIAICNVMPLTQWWCHWLSRTVNDTDLDQLLLRFLMACIRWQTGIFLEIIFIYEKS